MIIYHALFNPLAHNGKGKQYVNRLGEIYAQDTILYEKLTDIPNIGTYLTALPKNDKVILCGGDGTLNRFVNTVQGMNLQNEILYFPIGTGNDFAQDLGRTRECTPFAINNYITDLPLVTVHGEQHRFINGIGYGIDGYCCEVADRMKNQKKKNINYTSIALSGLLLHYHPTDATVTVDGVQHTYKKVWLAPTMNGRYFGGGMMPTPAQKRNSGILSVMVFHDSGRLKTLSVFPSIFKGKHILHKKNAEILEGREITVTFNRPTPLQIDGETVTDVLFYKAVAAGSPC